MQIKNTSDVVLNGLTVLVYGVSGAGKTSLIKTIPGRTLILSAEGGLLSLQGTEIEYVEIHSLDDLYEAYQYIGEHLADYNCIVLDSLSEIGEVILANEKKLNKDGRQAYMQMQDQLMELIRAFRDLSISVYMTCKLEKMKDDITGRIMFAPSLPGQKCSQNLPYFFDEVLALRSETDEENKNIRFFQTFADSSYCCKDRSGKLDAYEEADLGKVMAKIGGQK